MITLTVDTPEAMAALGARIAGQLRAGDLVALNGPLGAGKTTLTRGLGAALGVRGAVTSPTFVLARTHPRADPADATMTDAAPLVHVDAYRLAGAAELDDLDIDFGRSIVVVEWAAGMLDGISDSWLTVDIVRPVAGVPRAGVSTGSTDGGVSTDDEYDGPEPRTVTITGSGPRWKDLGWVGAASD